jgi:hypothetical protein
MKRRKEDYFVIGLALTLVVIVFVIVIVLTFSNNANTEKQEPLPTVIPLPTEKMTNIQPQTHIYDQQSFNQLLQKIQYRTQVSPQDSSIKKQILSLIPNNETSGMLYENQNIRIDYTGGPDLFQVEIMTMQIKEAKEEGNQWFLSQGMSQQAICDLPVDFYLSWEIMQQLSTNNRIVSFSPFASECK